MPIDREAIIHARAADNAGAVAADGPRLRIGAQTWILASADRFVLVGGLGAMGNGRMWTTASARHRLDPTFEEAPVDPTAADDFGAWVCVACHQVVKALPVGGTGYSVYLPGAEGATGTFVPHPERACDGDG